MDELHTIRTFIRVVETGSFSAVARETGLGQPAVSKQVAALETRLGAQLLRRSSRNLSLTEVGQAYFESVVPMLEELSAAESRVRVGQTEPDGLVRLSCSPVLGGLYLVPRLEALFERHPKLAVELRASERTPNLIEEGLDLAIHTGELKDSALTVRTIASTPVITVASPEYLSKHGTPKRPADLESNRHRCIVFTPFGAPSPWRFQTPAGLVEFEPKGSLRTNDAEHIREAALNGLGLAFAPGWLFARDLSAGSVRRVLRTFEPPRLPICTVHPAGRRVPNRVRVVIDWVAEIFERDPNLVALASRATPDKV